MNKIATVPLLVVSFLSEKCGMRYNGQLEEGKSAEVKKEEKRGKKWKREKKARTKLK